VNIGRNDRCPCGSGKKYKQCCTQPQPAQRATLAGLFDLANTRRYADMEVAATKLVAAHPRSGIAWKSLGVALSMQNKDALAALEKASQLLPADPEAQSNFGTALRRAGRCQEAVQCFRRALDVKPQIAEVWSNLGNALRDLGQIADAVEAYKRALSLNPGLPKSHNNLGNALQDLGKLDEAEASYRRALDLDARYEEAHRNLGIVLRLQGRTAEAEDCCTNALEIDPQSNGALVLLAELHSDKGEFTRAEEVLRRASALEPQSAEAWAGIAGLRRMSLGDSAWLDKAQRLAAQGLSPLREVPLRYAIGKYFDDVGDYERAFENYRHANELARLHRPAHDRRRVTLGIDRLIEVYDAQWVTQLRDDANHSERPVVIVGMPRSGTTLAEQMLASHAEVFGAGELSFWNRALSADDPRQPGVIGKLAAEYLTTLDGLSREAVRVIDKMPANFLYLGLIHAVLPKARIIHMRRSPIDTCLSIYFQNFGAVHSYANDLADLAHYYREYLRIMDHWRGLLSGDALLDVPYEELVAEPERWARRMVAHLGLSWDPSCLAYHRSTRTISTFSKWQARQSTSKSSIARWRNYERFIAPLLCLEAESAGPHPP
jgi:tetratricopeptide (TPR) repeat protein